jgi:hypothetical protein
MNPISNLTDGTKIGREGLGLTSEKNENAQPSDNIVCDSHLPQMIMLDDDQNVRIP